MVVLDDRILETLSDESGLPPHLIALDLDRTLDEHRVVNRLRVLSQAGYVSFPETQHTAPPCERDYAITVWGRLYLDGDVRADLLVPEPSPARSGYVLR